MRVGQKFTIDVFLIDYNPETIYGGIFPISDSPLALVDAQGGDTLLRYGLGEQPVTEGGSEIEIEKSEDDSSSEDETTDSNDVSSYVP